MKRSLCVILGLQACLCAVAVASDVERIYLKGDVAGTEVSLLDKRADYWLDFRLLGDPAVMPSPSLDEHAWVLQYAIENRRGLGIQPARLLEGDVLLEPLRTVDGVHVKERGETITAEDIAYLRAKSFRTFYDRGGGTVSHNSFKEGDILELYKRVFDARNQAAYEESGFQTMDGQVVIPNGTTLTKRHIAMLTRRTLMPARVRGPVRLDLDVYLRVDWPDNAPMQARHFWVKRGGEPRPLSLLPYQLKEGDVPVGRIIKPDGTVLCPEGVALQKDGPLGSLAVLDRHPDAVMTDDKGRPIVSIDPVSGAVDTYQAEPGELVMAPQDRFHQWKPHLVLKPEDLAELAKQNLSFALSWETRDAPRSFPLQVHFTHYPMPVQRECLPGCDNLLDISKVLLTGETACDACKREVRFTPPVRRPIPSYPFQEESWLRRASVCAYCGLEFQPWQAHDRTDPAGESPDIAPQAAGLLHPSRLRANRMGKLVLSQDVAYRKSGEVVKVPAGTEVSDDLRRQLEERPVSPLSVRERKEGEDARDMMQCPGCYGWNAKPVDVFKMTESIDVDEVRRGIVSFKYLEDHVNKLEIVVFGLRPDREPTSGRDLAHVVTMRRVGDEQFQEFSDWTVTASAWKFLPRYAFEDGMHMPVPALEQKAVDVEKGLE